MDHTKDDMQAFRKSVREIDVNSNPSSWYLPFDSADLVRPALTAPVCQLVQVAIVGLVYESLILTFSAAFYFLATRPFLQIPFIRPSPIATTPPGSLVATGRRH